ncbi:hypothetical protein G7Z17_g3167 [Cylindrodendrum hubeiense]|uniref:Cas1p 10 TM acyl transferase domain-containing protein n=1 Tax=Cylindrodendrum hubeiense TaxID=595255 RepID=A0A9P5HBE5_9HYPO|nr:hypothetical protein G7Z17_g3167 [Cylindrodendrum hubeiense]
MWYLVFSKIILIVPALLLLVAVGYTTVFPGDDPYRCRSVLERGRWIDRPDVNGSRLPLKNWQPDGCILHHYSSTDIRRCMEGRYGVFIGDSTSRGVAYGLGRLLQRDEATYDAQHYTSIYEFNITYHGVRIQRIANVYLQTHGYPLQNGSITQLSRFGNEKRSPMSIKDQKGPAFVYVAAGAWYTNGSSKFDDPEGLLQTYREAVYNVSEIVGDTKSNLFTDPMDPFDGVGNQILFAPPGGPRYLGDKPFRIENMGRRYDQVKAMQGFLREATDDLNFPLAWAVPELTEGQDGAWRDPLLTGWHVIDSVAETRANILLNMRCNAKLDRMKGYPYNRTCCTDYGNKPWVQLVLVAVGLVWLTACVTYEIFNLITKRYEPQQGILSMETGSFVLALLMCYYADRTQLMAKGAKVWELRDFIILCVPCMVIALVTIRRSITPTAKEPLFAATDQPFLSRDQTDEWKGWMQFIILIYHWVAAQPDSIYMLVRLLVAAYLFQTGYGHTLFFLNKKDFSFKRVASVLLRLNLMSCSLAYFMNTNYMFYYFSPLVSFWFLIVYATMAIGHERFNDDIQSVIAKIFVSALLVSGIILATPLTKWIFIVLQAAFRIQWSLSEWQYRVSLDLFIVYIGMLFAVAYFKFQGNVILGLRIILSLFGGFATYGYFHFNWKDYRAWHPYTSFVPVFAFIAIRNITAWTRNYHSKAMAWLGRCSLETYTLQFHLLLAADASGILLVDGLNDGGDLMGRWKSLIIIVPIFLWISSAAAKATGHLVKIILHTSSSGTEKMSGPPGARFMERIGGASVMTTILNSPQFRVSLILVVLWFLNLLSPAMSKAPAPDGFTPHRVNVDKPSATSHIPIPTPH